MGDGSGTSVDIKSITQDLNTLVIDIIFNDNLIGEIITNYTRTFILYKYFILSYSSENTIISAPMFLTRIIYTSTATQEFKPNDIDDILTIASNNNTKIDITGMLCFSRNYFLQCLEGSRSCVNEMYHKILNDKRHSNIVLLEYNEISEREFSQWSMAYLPESSLTSPINLKFSESSQFNPYKMSGESAHKMMLEFKDKLDCVSKS